MKSTMYVYFWNWNIRIRRVGGGHRMPIVHHYQYTWKLPTLNSKLEYNSMKQKRSAFYAELLTYNELANKKIYIVKRISISIFMSFHFTVFVFWYGIIFWTLKSKSDYIVCFKYFFMFFNLNSQFINSRYQFRNLVNYWK